ncbi:MAG: hypothetical protein K0S44_2451 [Bacteroidetes bacterium]|jgi:uncharacterized repeat protein (TIGR01451 family)|nr:hypothetical protein [Bacteroidota bacterium]
MKKIFTLLFVIAITSLSFGAGHTVTVSSTDVSCFGGNNGTATAMVVGGSGSFTYSWSPFGGTLSTVTGITAGSYTVTVTDNSDMSTATASVVVMQPTQLIVNTAANPASCNGICDGSVSAMVSGGTPPYFYSWAPMGGLAPVSMGLCPGSYTVVVTDSYGCTSTGTATVTSAGAPITGITVTDSIYNETCLSSGDGAIDITLSGSNPGPFTYQWNNGQTTQDALGLVSNFYTVVIFDTSMNCMSLSYQIQAIGTNCGGIEGKVYVDLNSDCAMNGGDIGLSNIMITTSPGNYYAFTNSAGEYHFTNLPYGTYALYQQINNPYISANYYCPGPVVATINGSNPFLTNQNFSDTAATVSGPDVSVTGFLSPLRPGFPSQISLVLSNMTVMSASGVVKTSLPPGYGALINSGSPSGYVINADTISWNYSGLVYGSANFTANFTVPISAPLGTTYTSCATAIVTGGDADLINNYNCFSRMVMGSYDPNDKAVSPQGFGPQGNITLTDTELTYMIRFQNTGNAEAINIAVLDTISDKLDLTTLNVIGASHTYDLDVIDGNVLRFKFDNIWLPDSNVNEPASHGWILYKMDQNAANVLGYEIMNTAYIYFDFNEAVVTNTTLNTIAAPVGIQETIINGTVSVYPNPFSDQTTFVITSEKLNETYSFEMTDVLGKKVKEVRTNEKQFTVSRDVLQSGMYFYSITNSDGVVAKGKVIIK